MTEPDAAGPWTWNGSHAVDASTYRDLLRLAYVITGSAPTAEDVVQDVMCSVGPRLGTLDDPPAYLRVAVVNRCRSLRRRAKRAPRWDPPTPSAMDPGLVELRDQLVRLPIRQRTAIVLRYLCDLPEADIAAALACRPATVRSLIHRGLADLRTTLTKGNP